MICADFKVKQNARSPLETNLFFVSFLFLSFMNASLADINNLKDRSPSKITLV